MFRNPEEQAALALLLAVCDPESDVARAYTAESEAAAVREIIRGKLGEDAHYEVDPAYEAAVEANGRATFAFVTAPARSMPELALKLAAMLIDHEPGDPNYMHEPHEGAGWARVIAEIRAVAAAAK
jgi:hypothetical protein